MNRKTRRRLRSVGAVKVVFFAGLDDEGDAVGWFWMRDDGEGSQGEVHGPFDTKDLAEEDVRTSLFGPNTKIVEGGRLQRQPGERLQ